MVAGRYFNVIPNNLVFRFFISNIFVSRYIERKGIELLMRISKFVVTKTRTDFQEIHLKIHRFADLSGKFPFAFVSDDSLYPEFSVRDAKVQLRFIKCIETRKKYLLREYK